MVSGHHVVLVLALIYLGNFITCVNYQILINTGLKFVIHMESYRMKKIAQEILELFYHSF